MILARLLMLIQLVSIFPLLMYILRSQFLLIFSSDPSRLRAYNCIRHTVNVFCCFGFVIIAIKVSFISEVIRYVGAFTGAAIIFVAPCFCHWLYMHKECGGLFKLGWNPLCFVAELFIVAIGIANFLVQFAK